jgi:signal transduction histidine kinase
VNRSISITRRLVLTVLLLELLAAIGLITAVTVHERNVQLKAFDANLRGNVDALMGAVQDAEDTGDNVMLDLRGVQLPPHAIYLVEDEHGKLLGSAGVIPDLAQASESIQHVRAAGRSYRFFTYRGARIIDPGRNGGIRHDITILYGIPDGHVWHEVLEAVRFFAIATAVLLGITAVLMAWLVRRWLHPIHELAFEAGRISSLEWRFDAPASARRISELRPLATALEAALIRLELAFEQQKRFTNDAAHELKTDLAIVKSSLQLLSMKKRTQEEYTRGLALSLDDFIRLELTVQKMLTLARLEQPDRTHLGSCLLREAVEEAVQQSNPFAALRRITVLVNAASDVRVPLDNRDAVLLCSNILVNALQHSPEDAAVHLDLSSDGSQIRLTIRDHGEGIRDEDHKFLFEPFYRGDPSRSRKSGGTGLGLSICKAVCNRVGGSIEIRNHPDGGALVTVILPSLESSQRQEISASLKA